MRLIAAVMATALVGAPVGGASAGVDNSEEARVADVLQSALVAHGADVNRCFERALADTLDVAGKIDLSVDVGADGKVTHAEPARDDVNSPVLLACLEASALTWTLAGIEAGSTVVVPLAFEGQAAQFSIKVADAPEHGPPVPRGKHRAGSPAAVPPFSVKLLVDEATMRARKAALAQLTIAPANRIALHRHPGAEVLVVLRGHARVLGAGGVAPEKLDEGMAVYIPPQMPHAIENMGRSAPAVLLDLFVPPGPDRVYRNPKDPTGRAAFEVLHDPRSAANPPGAELVVASPAGASAQSVFGGKVKITPLFGPAQTGSLEGGGFYLGKLEAEPGAQVPRNTHAGSEEILFVTAGSGELTVGSEKIPFRANEALFLPAGQPHSTKFTGTDKTEMVQIFAPAGPGDRAKDATKTKP
ncbi:MAG TPA: cupin domain-containing protein [Polyangia bacterium]|nr:cupin domain-containing protein [Polyangia bacterium]